jgi:hypothetical protein
LFLHTSVISSWSDTYSFVLKLLSNKLELTIYKQCLKGKAPNNTVLQMTHFRLQFVDKDILNPIIWGIWWGTKIIWGINILEHIWWGAKRETNITHFEQLRSIQIS